VGASARLVVDIRVTRENEGARLVIRVSADATGPTARLALLVFEFVDSIMSRRQLLGIQQRVERFGARAVNPEEPETGSLDQYQLYEVIYASGELAGVPGKEHAAVWRRAAFDDGVLDCSAPTDPGAVSRS